MANYIDLLKRQPRLAGVLLHPTSLPSNKLDRDAYQWLDFMADAGLSVWQLLPLGVPQENFSPYQCYSAFALNPALISSSEWAEPDCDNPDFLTWFASQQFWLEDYALFMLLKKHFDNQAWNTWPADFRDRSPDVLQVFQEQHQGQINSLYWQQYRLYQCWQDIHDYAQSKDIMLFGDMPIFVAHDSADVWVHRESFLLDEKGEPTVVAGVPPDYFSETGQRWGNPHYNWDFMLENDFQWWLQRMQNHLALFDLVRIDHFRGLEAVWVIDSECETAIDGEWIKVPGRALLTHLQKDMGNIPVVAEDLGIITPEVEALRTDFNLPGMSVLQFSFDEFEDNPHKPQNIEADRIVYTGTHDNDTTTGWFATLDDDTQAYVMDILQAPSPDRITDTMIDTALSTQSQLAIAPLQDFLGMGSEARMNTPGISDDNWRWSFQWQDLPKDLALITRQRLEQADRLLPQHQETETCPV
ncbi:MAG: 4-alpha-glucanotransferase (amylomaltase) (EC [uncultured Thiotrichaceae bacterium]|uniref:4-alpha-glucanotransferase n=1 Tax=uncultured Thiotrichaceae bacterium TaxID=298394 RepID=A0A6S6UDQ2_9GAMM|nr:MAG: 4-alpha-glucanotransferase (amylomaltase) (EC [uncultured Thiotrichaceae bacterium]